MKQVISSVIMLTFVDY